MIDDFDIFVILCDFFFLFFYRHISYSILISLQVSYPLLSHLGLYVQMPFSFYLPDLGARLMAPLSSCTWCSRPAMRPPAMAEHAFRAEKMARGCDFGSMRYGVSRALKAAMVTRRGRCEALRFARRRVVDSPRLKAMGCRTSAPERYAPPGERSKAAQGDQGAEASAGPQAIEVLPTPASQPFRQSAQPAAEDARAAEWQRPDTWPARKDLPTPSRDAPHVVLSTKFEEPWYTVSRGLKEILQERGCTVYNPNTDNKEPRLELSGC